MLKKLIFVQQKKDFSIKFHEFLLFSLLELHHKEEEEEEEKKKQLFVKPEDRVALIPFRGETGIEERPRKNTDTPLDTPCPPTTGGFMDVLGMNLYFIGGS